MHKSKWLIFSGLGAGISMDVDQRFLDCLPEIFVNWPYQLVNTPPQTSFAEVTFEDGKYTISSGHMDAPVRHRDPVNAICCLIVELAWAHLRADTHLLCLHSAAIEFNGHLVVFPSTRRAGKSTLSVAMMAAGRKLFTDDFLPLLVGHNGSIQGLSHGIAPRLRLPLPDQIGQRTRYYIDQQNGITNRQYHYVIPQQNQIARFGETAPVGALVFLDQKSGSPTSLTKIEPSTALRNLIAQNFSRAMNAAAILEILAATAHTIPAYRLDYDDVDRAVAVLEDHFRDLSGSAKHMGASSRDNLAPAPDAVETPETFDWRGRDLVHRNKVTDLVVGHDRFLATPNGREIHHLNSAASVIWQLLIQPTNLAEVTEHLGAIYPEQPKAQLARDASNTINSFLASGLLRASTIQDVCVEEIEQFDVGKAI